MQHTIETMYDASTLAQLQFAAWVELGMRTRKSHTDCKPHRDATLLHHLLDIDRLLAFVALHYFKFYNMIGPDILVGIIDVHENGVLRGLVSDKTVSLMLIKRFDLAFSDGLECLLRIRRDT